MIKYKILSTALSISGLEAGLGAAAPAEQLQTDAHFCFPL